jgi:hypothetical protein
MYMRNGPWLLASSCVFWSAIVGAKTLSVGPGATFATPCKAFAAAADGDRIEIDALGSYAGDVCAIARNSLTIVGVGGRAKIDANGKNALGKAIWVVQGNDTTIENIEFSGASVPDMNGAGIRQEGNNLTVRKCSFHDNQDGILAGDAAGSEILIESSEFDHNGAGDGYSHNLYINHVARLTFRYNYSHRAVEGHLLKTRAAENFILYNRLSGEDGTQSYEVDVPNGGKTYVIGNIIEQGATTHNPTMLAYLAEGATASNPSHALFVVNNSFVNDLGRGTFVSIGSAASVPPILRNNIFFGAGTLPNEASAANAHNYSGTTSCFVDPAHLDVHLAANTPCIDGGIDPGSDADFSLAPSEQYQHPASHEARLSNGPLDIGAYEYASTTSGTGGAGSGGAAAKGGAPGSGGALGKGGTTSGGATAKGGAPASGGASNDGGAGASGAAAGSTTTLGGTGGAAPGTGGNETSSLGGAATAGAVAFGGAAPSAGAGGNEARSDEGCGCRVGPSSNRSFVSLILALSSLHTLRRRSRERRRASR